MATILQRIQERGALGLDVSPQETMMTRLRKKLVHEGEFVAEVTVQLLDDEYGWAPYLSLPDAEKLDTVRQALREADVATASRLATVYRLMPVSA